MIHTKRIPGSPFGGPAVTAEPEGRRLRELFIAVLGPEHALLSAHPEPVGAVRPGLELVLQKQIKVGPGGTPPRHAMRHTRKTCLVGQKLILSAKSYFVSRKLIVSAKSYFVSQKLLVSAKSQFCQPKDSFVSQKLSCQPKANFVSRKLYLSAESYFVSQKLCRQAKANFVSQKLMLSAKSQLCQPNAI